MLYIFESELPENMSVRFALLHIGGIGRAKSALICKTLGFLNNFRIRDLTREQLSKLISCIESLNMELSGDLKKLNLLVTKRLITIKSYRGLRKSQGLPVRGQRTHTNAKTARKRR